MDLPYSNVGDCFELFKSLKVKLKDKIECCDFHQEMLCGIYISQDKRDNDDAVYRNGIPFYCKFSKNYLNVAIGSFYPYKNSVGEKLAILSEFYEILREIFNEPTLFYTIENDEEGLLSLHWAFTNKEEQIKEFTDNTYYWDAKVTNLVIFNPNHGIQNLGLPIELLPLIKENIHEYVKYKNGNFKNPELINDINIQTLKKQRLY